MIALVLAAVLAGGANGAGAAPPVRSTPAPPPRTVEALRRDLDALDLPLILELVERPRAILVFVSGDGGWSQIDKTLVAELASHGVSTVGLNTLKYFWSEKAPDRFAKDLVALTGACARGGQPVFAGGYSFGAEVVPVVVDRPELSSLFRGLILMSPGPYASFEVTMMDWLRRKEKKTPYSVLEHARALRTVPILCSAGDEDEGSICPSLRGDPLREVLILPGAHHYNGEYDDLAASARKFVLKTLEGSGDGGAPASR